MIKNPILPGFNPDPCICRKGDDYYLVVSSFEWFPGIPVYHSKDLKNWELYTHILTDETKIDLKKLPSSKGIWAPCLTYCEEEDLFYIVYGIMNSMNARYFDVDNYLITSKDIKGEWSEPVYIHSSGFDASILHDDDGKKWIASLDWETREGYEKPGVICLVEYCTKKKEIVGYPKRIWSGGTDRGCIEAPHITKRGDYYYIMCAEGGTGYGHSVTMGRAKNIWRPYEKDSMNPIVTSIPGDFYERHDPDHLKPKYYNPESKLQKSGHGSYIETTSGEVYLVHLTSRPFVPELRCTLGRETAIQKMKWTKDNWLRMEDESNLAKEYVSESKLEEHLVSSIPSFDDFDSNVLGLQYYAPRISPLSFADVKSRPGYVRIRGQESRTSLNKVSILARKLTSVYARITTKMEFYPEVHQHSAGLIMYYDNMNYINLRKYYSETLGQSALSIIHLENGEKTEFLNTRIPIKDIPIYLRLYIQGRKSYFEWSYDEKNYQRIGKVFDTTKFSDEYCKYVEFTGTFIGLTCADRVKHKHYADFDFFEYIADESKDVD
ncbi:glycoside hydrolase family 43 protein [Clostridioides difficile]|uniref:glycoside hydrolase family 43 protein n=1 Tax=Clostridioides difficile TaxID=1496 RepID=UPI00038CA8EB|nr:glycoside hydrolase family 43 protein [Clostridioides difficile]EQI15067.1 xylan beta-1,4-xylosidase [Clostridioides difficile F253]